MRDVMVWILCRIGLHRFCDRDRRPVYSDEAAEAIIARTRARVDIMLEGERRAAER